MTAPLFSVPFEAGHPSGVGAVFKAIDALDAEAAEHQRVLDENAELRCRVQELEAQVAELEDQIGDYQWEHKDDRPPVEKAIAGCSA